MITSPAWLYPAYAFNIMVLVPVVYSMLFGAGVTTVFEGKVQESQGLRLMVGSLWFAILLASLVGLAWPSPLAPILVIQIFYKSLWLLLFVRPLMRADKPWPVGITSIFAIIVATYPVLLLFATHS
jgi:hypothetical protein